MVVAFDLPLILDTTTRHVLRNFKPDFDRQASFRVVVLCFPNVAVKNIGWRVVCRTMVNDIQPCGATRYQEHRSLVEGT